MRNRKSLSRKGRSALAMAIAASLGAASAQAQTQNSTWNATLGGNPNWNVPSNWSPTGIPNNGTNGFTDYNVTIGSPASTNLNVNVTIDDLNLETGGILDIEPGFELTLNGSAVTDNGQILINPVSSGAVTILNFAGDATVLGTGSISLGTNTSFAQLNGTLTQAVGHTIQGLGEINAALTNDGNVDANTNNQILYLQTNNMTNSATFQATLGGTLEINGITVTQGTAGQILAGTNGLVSLNSGGTVAGGTLNSTGGSFIQIIGTDTISNLTNDAPIKIAANNTLDVIGNLVDNGEIEINPGNAGGATILNFAGGNVSGTGAIVLGTNTTNAQLNGTLTQAATHTIEGFGEINASLINNGLVEANVDGQNLFLQTSNMTNSATFEATNDGGTLDINGITVTQSAAGQVVAGTNCVVVLNGGATVNGGTLSSTGNGNFQVEGGTDTIGSLTNDATIDVIVNNTLDVTGNLVDNGEIEVNPGNAGGVTILDFAGGNVSGTGAIVLGTNTTNAQLNGTLTQASTHTIEGFGQINAALTNNGTVNSNVDNQILYLLTNNMTNSATFEATNGGTLEISGSLTITQTASGQITAGTNSEVVVNSGATISGGTLNSTGNGFFDITAAGTIAGLTNDATIKMPAPGTLNVTGNLVDNGEIQINPGNAGGVTILDFAGGTVSGTGAFILGTNTANAQVNGTLTQTATHTIAGLGEINAALTNDGTVDANADNQSLFLQTSNMTNSATFEATNGGTLNISGITVTQGAAGQITAENISGVTIAGGAIIQGGTLNSAGSGAINVTLGTLLNVAISTGSQVNVPLNDKLSFVGATLTNNGTLTVNQSTAVGNQLAGTGALIVESTGVMQLAANSGLSTVGSLTINSNGKLDITNNSLAINFPSPISDPVSTIVGYLSTGYASGAWTGIGIYSSTAAAGFAASSVPVLSVGYADGNVDTGQGNSTQTPAQPNQVLVKFTLAGDAFLNGIVNFNDLDVVGKHLNTSGNDWASGNFNYDPAGAVNFNDLDIVGQNLNKTIGDAGEVLGGSTVSLGEVAGIGIQNTIVTPEPGALALIAAGVGGLLARRRKKSVSRFR